MRGIRKARLEDGQPCNVRVCVGSAIQKHTKSVCVHAPCVDVNVVWRCRVCVDDHNGYIGKRRFEIDAFLDYSFSARHDHQPAGLYMGYGMLCHGECDRSVDEGVAYLSAERVDRYGPICLDLDHDVSGAG